MIFTSFNYLYFLVLVVSVYWALPSTRTQNLFITICSYLFYGWVHPWFCLLIATSTIVDFFCGLGMGRSPHRKRRYLVISLVSNLGMLGVFKYFNFFVDNVEAALVALGFHVQPIALRIFLPVGISFYTFQTLSYTIDIYRGKMQPRTNFIDFAFFVSFFPQLVAGPIERATRLLPQIESKRVFRLDLLDEAWPLLVRGYMKKLLIADNVAIYSDKVFMLEHPSLLLLLSGGLAFTVQILADFSAYTDIARGTARLMGFSLMENFHSPYLAISPSDFWRRWHVSFSSWIRDYLYIPLGGSKTKTSGQFGLVVLATMSLSGLWHGAAWNFIAWGVYHGLILFTYHQLGFAGRWEPRTLPGRLGAWSIMFCLTVGGWLLFRAPSLGWLVEAVSNAPVGLSGDSSIVAVQILAFILLYTAPMLGLLMMDRLVPNRRGMHTIAYGMLLFLIVIFHQDGAQDFIYFQF